VSKTMRWAAMAALVALLGLLVAAPALAGSEGRRNTAAALGGAAVYELIRGNTENGVLLGAGAAVAYERYREARDQELRDGNWGYYDRYGHGYRSGDYTRLDRCHGCQSRTYLNRGGYCQRCESRRWEQSRERERSRYQDRDHHCYSCGRQIRERSGYCEQCRDRESYRHQPSRQDGHYRNVRRPPGWDRGVKAGWDGYRVPPGQRR